MRLGFPTLCSRYNNYIYGNSTLIIYAFELSRLAFATATVSPLFWCQKWDTQKAIPRMSCVPIFCRTGGARQMGMGTNKNRKPFMELARFMAHLTLACQPPSLDEERFGFKDWRGKNKNCRQEIF
ncbi:hypothetical protein CEXT_263511 [Caerostris extrusa]|uniref:Uncharacterized protein n=1 Tax=Caerostris extrusa TaxID=172846 RepID=A0AAV4Y6W7_CAEEX|nr:hypothetical protein CEXT_263511 [Caerostris extrusa]